MSYDISQVGLITGTNKHTLRSESNVVWNISVCGTTRTVHCDVSTNVSWNFLNHWHEVQRKLHNFDIPKPIWIIWDGKTNEPVFFLQKDLFADEFNSDK